MASFNPDNLPTGQLHGLLLGAIGPRPIAFASTIDAQGRPNLAPFSFFNVFSARPPILIFSPARRGRDNTTKHTFDNVIAHPEVVINIVNYNMVQQMSLASSDFDAGISEFDKAGFTPLPSLAVKPFRVKESPAQFECKVNEVVELGNNGGAGNLVICQVVQFHIDDALLDSDGRIDQTKIDTIGRMGGEWYTRANGSALFEVAKPGAMPGMGFELLPTDIRQSHILSGNDLGQLANVHSVPDETAVNEYRLTELSELFITLEHDAEALEDALHRKAKAHLSNGLVREAWLTLLSFNN